MTEKKWNETDAEADVDDLKDEIMNLTAALIEMHEMTEKQVRTIARKALASGKVRKVEPAVDEWRFTTSDDLLQDLEIACVALKNSRMVMGSVTRGVKLTKEAA